jgi:hypothetical protein
MHPDRLDALTRRLGEATSRRGFLGVIGVGVVGTAVTAVGVGDTQAKSKNKHRQRNKGSNDNGNNGNGDQNKNGPKNSGPFERMSDIPISAHDQQGHNFEGTLTIKDFAESESAPGTVVAHGTVSGKVTGKGVGNQTVTQDVTLPVSVQNAGTSVHSQATCQVLDLVLGPIDLNLLGLVLHVNQIHILLTANSLGGILGSLLCSLAGPISGLSVDALLDLLTSILHALQGA